MNAREQETVKKMQVALAEDDFAVEAISIGIPAWANHGLDLEQEERLKDALLRIPGVSGVTLYAGGTLEISEAVRLAEIQRKATEVCRVHALNPPPLRNVSEEAVWRFGATKGSIYMYPADGGVQAGYKWVATTDPELVGLPEDQEAMEAMARQLADSANACLGMKDPVAEVAQLRVASQRAAGAEMDGAQRDRSAAASSEPGLGR
ncbi:hypothetical protein [Paracidovorax wautersii]|uniref:Uncharacterized protein n=1 Tax=Paracidovorax wautersii TaxID=1177982 RepID=A0A1I2HYA0_9BURK|nr:hypothetical protein [Paracidovorax wautersii]SFF33757.1 hypothetical protein SAMN04489711_1374 [Paracidovorax wautersii]